MSLSHQAPTTTSNFYFQVSNFVFGAEFKKYRLLPVDRLLLLSLSRYKGLRGIFPSTNTLANELGVSATYVKRIISKLESLNILKVTRKRGCSNRYELLIVQPEVIHNRTLPSSKVIHNRSTPVDRYLSTTGQLQVHNRVTTVDTISLDNKLKQRERSLYNFEPDEANILLAKDFRLDLKTELKSFEERHRGRKTQYEFSRWLKAALEYRSRREGAPQTSSRIMKWEPGNPDYDRCHGVSDGLQVRPELTVASAVTSRIKLNYYPDHPWTAKLADDVARRLAALKTAAKPYYPMLDEMGVMHKLASYSKQDMDNALGKEATCRSDTCGLLELSMGSSVTQLGYHS